MELAILLVSAAGVAVAVGLGVPALWYARRAEARVNARSDVSWHLARTGPGEFVVQNTGRDTAFEVRCLLTIGDDLNESVAVVVLPGGTLPMNSSRAKALHDAERLERLRYEAERDAPPAGYPYIDVPPMPHFSLAFPVSARVTWRSKAGELDSQTVEIQESREFGSGS